jgi:hypothetical protein
MMCDGRQVDHARRGDEFAVAQLDVLAVDQARFHRPDRQRNRDATSSQKLDPNSATAQQHEDDHRQGLEQLDDPHQHDLDRAARNSQRGCPLCRPPEARRARRPNPTSSEDRGCHRDEREDVAADIVGAEQELAPMGGARLCGVCSKR